MKLAEVAINGAPSQCRAPALGAAVAAMLKDCGIAPDMLTLEVTELSA